MDIHIYMLRFYENTIYGNQALFQSAHYRLKMIKIT